MVGGFERGESRSTVAVVTRGGSVPPPELLAGAPIVLAEAGSVGTSGGAEVAALHGAASCATADALCFLPRSTPGGSPAALARLAGALGEGVVAATPTLVHPERPGRHRTEHDLAVRAEGYTILTGAAGAPYLVARAAGERPDPARPVAEVDAAPLTCLMVDRTAYDAVGGLRLLDDPVAAGVDLCLRLRRAGGRIVHVPGAWVYDDAPVTSRRALTQPLDPCAPAWRALVEHHGPAARPRPRSSPSPAAPRWVITTAAPSRRVAERWGDWHLAEGLARALRQLGQHVVVQPQPDADSLASRSSDVHLVLHGLTSVRRTRGQRHIVWVISHPERFDIREADAADLVVVASEPFAAELRTRTATPVEVLLQATDPARFSPRPVDPRHRHPVTVVAKTRDVLRRSVADALDAGIAPAIYGAGWRQLVDPSLVVADHVDNEDLPVVYSSAGVVLNDHWDTMRAWGFISNRIFDVLACGTPVVSDDVVGLRELLHDTVPTYASSAELGEHVRAALADPATARARAADGRALVLADHTFTHRARQLLDLLARHDLAITTS
jgi:glycosyltransferase involved in cell wall biosynthesis